MLGGNPAGWTSRIADRQFSPAGFGLPDYLFGFVLRNSCTVPTMGNRSASNRKMFPAGEIK